MMLKHHSAGTERISNRSIKRSALFGNLDLVVLPADKRRSSRKSTWRYQQQKAQLNQYSPDGHHIADATGPVRKMTMQPTYRMEPQRPLRRNGLQAIMERSMQMALANQAIDHYIYNSTRANRFCQHLARDIMLHFRAEDFDRYRAVCMVNITEKNNQSVQLRSGFLLDAHWDYWCSHTIDMSSFLLHACLFSVYYE